MYNNVNENMSNNATRGTRENIACTEGLAGGCAASGLMLSKTLYYSNTIYMLNYARPWLVTTCTYTYPCTCIYTYALYMYSCVKLCFNFV